MNDAEGDLDRVDHWNRTYLDKGDDVSWFQAVPTVSLELIDHLAVVADTPVIDIGGGASRLVDELAARGFRDLTVLDVSDRALAMVADRLAEHQAAVRCIASDITTWKPERRYGLWHDRAVLHFLTDEAERARYRAVLDLVVSPGGAVIIATFASDGPDACSGLPVRRHGAADLFDFLGDAFDPVTDRHEVHRTPWGTDQAFTWVAARRRRG